MKKIATIFFLVTVLFSCSKETLNNEISLPIERNSESSQVFKLVAMSGSISGAPQVTGNGMRWQENYTLEVDQTFIKSRVTDNQTIQQKGTYAFITLSDGEYLELTYFDTNPIIGNCTSAPKELLKIEESNQLIGTWWACDGPGLFYNRIN